MRLVGYLKRRLRVLKTGVLRKMFWLKTGKVMMFFSSETHASDKHIVYCVEKCYGVKKLTGSD